MPEKRERKNGSSPHAPFFKKRERKEITTKDFPADDAGKDASGSSIVEISSTQRGMALSLIYYI